MSSKCSVHFSRLAHKRVQGPCLVGARKELSLHQKNKGAAIEKPLFVDQGCLKMAAAGFTGDPTSLARDNIFPRGPLVS